MKKILTFLLLSILIPIQMQAGNVSTWTEEVRNGNLEGSSTTCFRVMQGGSLATNFISEVGGVNNSRCIKIQSDGSDNAQSTALAITTPNKKWMAGDSIDVQFMVCAAQATTIYAKTVPNNSSSSNNLVPFLDGTYQVNKNWKILSYKGVVTSEQAGRNGTDGFILLLNTPGETNTFFFDNISVKSQKTTYVADPIETVIDNVNYRLDPNTLEATVISYWRYSGVIAIPSSVTYDDETYNVIAVDDMAFSASGVPTNVILSDGVTTLGTEVFGSQTTTVTLPSTLTSVGDALFLGCDNLQSVTCFATTPPAITSGSRPMISTPNTATLYVPAGSLSAYQDAPGWSVFSNIEEINTTEAEVTIDGIYYRLNLVTNEATVLWTAEWPEEVNIPATVTSADVGYDVTTVNGWAITSSTITSINLPEGLTTIGNGGIYSCSSLTTVSLPSTLSTIGTYTFLSCESLTSVYCYAETPPTLTEMDGGICELSVPNTATLYVPAGSLSAYQNATGWSSFNNIVEMVEPFEVLIGGINYSLDPKTHEATVIYKWRYSGDITIPSSVSFEDQTYAVTSIYEYAFTGMDLTSITLPEGLTTIGNGAFSSNASLTSVTLPSTLTNVGSFIFYHSSHLETVYCYATTPPTLSDGTIISTPNTAMLFVPEGSVSAYQNAPGWQDFNAVYGIVTSINTTIDGINYEIDLRNQTAEVVGNWTTGYSGDITIPSSVTYNGGTYPVTAVRGYSFLSSAITSVTVSEGLTTIGDGAFNGCLSLTTVSLPSTLTSVGQYLFMGMPSDDMVLESVYCYATTPPVVVGEGSIYMIPENNTATLYVPAGSLSAYQNAPGWSQFSNIVEMGSLPSGPELIVNGDFEGTDMSAFSGQQLGGGSFNRYDYTTDNIVSWDGDGNHFLYVYFTPVEINESTGEPWAYQDQLIIKLNGSLAPGDHFRFSMRAKNSGGAITINGHGNNGSVWNLLGEFNLTDEWQTFVVEGVVDETLSNDITKLELYLPVTDSSMGSFMFDDFSLKKVVETIPGDVNGDSEVDVADFTLLANYLLGKSPAGFNVEAADVAGGPGGAPDGSIDIADLTGIANIILHSHSSGE